MDAAAINDNVIRQALALYLDACGAQSPAGAQDQVFSERYKARIRLILSAGKRRESRRKVWRSAAAVLIVLVLSFGMVMAFSAEARASVQEWLIKTYREIIKYEFKHTEDDHAYVICAPGSLPDGFERTENTIKDNYTLKIYKDPQTGDHIRFEYSKATESMIAEVRRQNAGAELLCKDGIIEKYCVQTAKGCRVCWYDPQCELVFFVDSSLDKTALAACLETISFRLPLYEPTWLPEGYEEIIEERQNDLFSTEMVYINAEGEMILYSYLNVSATDIIQIDQLGKSIVKEPVMGFNTQAFYYPFSDGRTGGDLIWLNEDGNMIFLLSASLEKDGIIHIAESITCTEIVW